MNIRVGRVMSMPAKHVKRILRGPARRVDRFFHRLLSLDSDPLGSPLIGDRCIEYAYVVEQLMGVPRDRVVLDVGCSGSPLTTIIKSLGFQVVHGIDLLPSPVRYNGVNFIQGDFLEARQLMGPHDVVIFCSSIEHFGLAGRYNSPNVRDGDVHALRRAHELLPPGGLLILTIPYGVEKVVWPLHRVYNKDSQLLRYAFRHFELLNQEYYRNDGQNIWTESNESQARSVHPTAENYALGLFMFSKPA
jgi:SAM-dependent methyltransferase